MLNNRRYKEDKELNKGINGIPRNVIHKEKHKAKTETTRIILKTRDMLKRHPATVLICINKTRTNTLVTITDGKGNVKKRFSAGMMVIPGTSSKLHGSKRKTRYASELVMRATVGYLKSLRKKKHTYGVVILGKKSNIGIKVAAYTRPFRNYIYYKLRNRLIHGSIRPRFAYNGCRLRKRRRK